METSRMLKLKMNTSIYSIDGFNLLLKNVETLILDGAKDVEKMFYDQSIEGLQHLKHLAVHNVSDIKVVVNSMMLVSCLESLELQNLMNLEAIFEHAQLKDEFFGRLRVIKVRHCKMLKNLLSFSLAQALCHQLEEIEVSECENMTELFIEKKTIGDEDNILEFTQLRLLTLKKLNKFNSLWYSKKTFQLARWLFDQKVIFPALEELDIAEMENLERLWPNQLDQHSFSKLTSIDLYGCPKLLNVFPSSMLTRLQKLNRLRIWNCESVDEIIYESESKLQEGGSSSAMQSDVITTLEFRRLTSLDLRKLPNLKSMYRKMLAINWPSLETIEMIGCEKVEILFGCEETSRGKSSSSEDAAGIPIQHPLFWVNQFTFPTLHKLALGWNAGMKEIWNCEGQQHASYYFPSLKVVLLHSYPKKVTKVPSYLLSLPLPNLQTLEIRDSYFKELMISQSEEGGDEKPVCLLFSQITQLSMFKLHELLHLWKEKEGFQNLRILEVDRCPKLRINLVPSSVSFRNLVSLEVSGCDGIIKLITHCTAKSLVQLKEMSILRCNAIDEIIEGGDDNDDDDDEISFPKLNKLTLAGLPKLESFSSSENYTFGFPYLKSLIIYRCPKMMMFSQRDSDTPMLHQVNIEYWVKEEHWEGNLNSTIQQLFRNPMSQESQNFKQVQSNPSTSNAQNLLEGVQISIEDEGNPMYGSRETGEGVCYHS